MKVKHALAALAMGGALAPGAAMARDLPAGGVTSAHIAAWLRQAGFTARINAEAAQPTISTSVDDVAIDIYLYDCAQARCRSLQLASGWDDAARAADKINAWNTDQRHVRAYQQAGSNLWAVYDLDVSPGGTYEALTGALTRFRQGVKAFKAYFAL